MGHSRPDSRQPKHRAAPTHSAPTNSGATCCPASWQARDVLIVSPLAALLSVVVGTLLGLIGGYIRGIADEVISRVMEAVLAIPVILMGLLVFSNVPCTSDGGGQRGVIFALLLIGVIFALLLIGVIFALLLIGVIFTLLPIGVIFALLRLREEDVEPMAAGRPRLTISMNLACSSRGHGQRKSSASKESSSTPTMTIGVKAGSGPRRSNWLSSALSSATLK